MTSVTRAEPAAKVARLSNGHTSQMRADAEHDEPFGLLDAIAVRLRISERFPFHVLGVLDFVGGAVADEDGFTAPFDDYLDGRMLVEEGAGTTRLRGVIAVTREAFPTGHLWMHTFLPSGMAPRSISTLAWARTSAEADMLTRKSVREMRISAFIP